MSNFWYVHRLMHWSDGTMCESVVLIDTKELGELHQYFQMTDDGVKILTDWEPLDMQRPYGIAKAEMEGNLIVNEVM